MFLKDSNNLETIINMGEAHSTNSEVTPINADLFNKFTNTEKIDIITAKFREIMETLGLDLTDDSLSGTPYRVAKMYVEEIFTGLDPQNKPRVALFENKYAYDQMLVERNITLQSMCEHHFVPIIGYAHVGYISNGMVIGLSKINRIVKYHTRKPQVQERLTREIADHLSDVLQTENVAVLINAKHYCVAMRGVEDTASSTVTAIYKGRFNENIYKEEFLKYLQIH